MKFIDALFVDVAFQRDERSRLLYAPFGALSRKNYVVDDPIIEASIRTYLRCNILITIAYIILWHIFEFHALVFLAGAVVLSAISIVVSNRLTRNLTIIERPRRDFIASMGWGRILFAVITCSLITLLCLLLLFFGWQWGSLTPFKTLMTSAVGVVFGVVAATFLWFKIKR